MRSDNPPGTLICDEEEIVEQEVVTGIAYAKDEAQISLRRLSGPARRFGGNFRPVGRCAHQCRHDRAEYLRATEFTDMTFTVPSERRGQGACRA
jgi:aspartate kinase